MAKQYSYGRQSISWKDIWEVVKVLRSPWLTQGPKVREFERLITEYTRARYAVVVSSGTAALHLAALALDLQAGDEIITSPITFVSSSNCALYVGAIPVFVDIDPKNGCIDACKIESHITEKTRAIIPVHFAGIPCDMASIKTIADKHKLVIIEDAAHALGGSYQGFPIGSCSHSDMTILSFHPVKTITSGEGGAITTNDPHLYERLVSLRAFGITRDPKCLMRNDGPWYYEMHDLGYNYRMSDIHATLGCSQFKRLELFRDKRAKLVEQYRKLCSDDSRISFLEKNSGDVSAWHLFPAFIDFEKLGIQKRDFFEALKKQGLFLQVHYIPVHTQPYYKRLGYSWGDFPDAERYYAQTISLPLYPGLHGGDIDEIVRIFRQTLDDMEVRNV